MKYYHCIGESVTRMDRFMDRIRAWEAKGWEVLGYPVNFRGVICVTLCKNA